eukprot:3561307-Pleurochrysis_carterae.AAC.1
MHKSGKQLKFPAQRVSRLATHAGTCGCSACKDAESQSGKWGGSVSYFAEDSKVSAQLKRFRLVRAPSVQSKHRRDQQR